MLRNLSRKPRVLIFIVAYNAEKTIQKVLTRIPDSLKEYDTEVLIIDDASADQTFERAEQARRDGLIDYPITVFRNPVNQRYGGNQKIGYHFAVENGFDLVALVHGDGQYAPEALPELIKPIVKGQADAVFGSRMMTLTGALKGGMPMYKYVGNRILTCFQNTLLQSQLSEFHSGYRLYSTHALRNIPFELNADDFHFDTEIIIQLLFAGLTIKEIPIPTYYGDEICHVNGLKYAWDVAKATMTARLQRYHLMYRRNFDVRKEESQGNLIYSPKLDFTSPHTESLNRVPEGATVVDIGCASGYLSKPLKDKNCKVYGVDVFPAENVESFVEFKQCDLDRSDFPVDLVGKDVVLLLDVIEHLKNPEAFAEKLHNACSFNWNIKVIISTGNVAFFIPRLMHLFGQFNYGKKGILDLTHTRLFTFSSLRHLLQESGFVVVEEKGIPAPFPKALASEKTARFLVELNQWLIGRWKEMFAYQIFMVVKPKPTLPSLLKDAIEHSRVRGMAQSLAEQKNLVHQDQQDFAPQAPSHAPVAAVGAETGAAGRH
ncbi:MAG: glycosyltransferase [Cyanobacteria bacterium SZAS LIN-3]|nr:glycosyltransferase [Cyanobacteria bacterium SZAS LIN-3]